MRAGDVGAGLGAPDLGDEHRLAGGAGARQRRDEAPWRDQPLDIAGDDTRRRIVDEILNEVGEFQIRLIADRDTAAEPSAAIERHGVHLGHQRARLADQRDAAVA